MKAIFLTSGPTFYKNHKIINKPLVEQLKKEIIKYDYLLLIASTPDSYDLNEKYGQNLKKELESAKIKFAYTDILDSRNWLFSKSLIKNADLIIVMGGDPLEQIEFLNNIDFKEKLKKFNGCLMGISAGSLNLANYVYCSQDKDIEQSVYYRGVGVTNLNIEPHFDINDTTRINNVLLKDSKERSFIALPNESFIVVKDNKYDLYGDAYYFENSKYRKIVNINDLGEGENND